MNATLPHLVTSFFISHLRGTLGRSPNTIASYTDTIRLLLNFAGERLHLRIDQLSMDAITDELVLEFLEHLTDQRGNGASTRHQRLAAIRTFYGFLAHHEPSLLATCERVHAIRIAVPQRPPITVLEPEQAKAILQAPDPSTALGLRDRAILLLLHNTGMRVQELCGLSGASLQCHDPPQVDIIGKGGKQRQLPLWPETVQAIQAYLDANPRDLRPDTRLFVSRTGRPLSRFGVRSIVRRHTATAARSTPDLAPDRVSPHTFRHTTATFLLRNHASIVEVRDWLGHSDVRTTIAYLHVDQEAKRQALQRCPAPTVADPAQTPQWTQPDVIAFLSRLARCGGVMLPQLGRPILTPPAPRQQRHITPKVT